MQNAIRSGSFRGRLTIVFIVVAGVAAGTIGLGSYLLVRDARTDSFQERAITDAEANHAALARRSLALSDPGLPRLLERLERRLVDGTVLVGRGEEYSSHPELSMGDIPEDLLAFSDGAFSSDHGKAAGRSFLVVATPRFSSPELSAYFFYSTSALETGLGDLARILWRLWLVVMVGSALVGNTVARRTLRPVSRASDAALSLAEGVLDTRLAVDREDEFGKWATSFNQMADALQVKVRELEDAHERERRFTSDVAHELRTPLTGLVTSASMLEQQLGDMHPEARWIGERLISETKRIRLLVDELLEISRLHSGRETLVVSEVDLDRIVREILNQEGWVDTVAFQSQGPLVVHSDKARIERVLVNLMSNAVEHGKVRPSIRLVQQDGVARVDVQDEGPGIPQEALPHLFDRFFKVDPSRAGGSGLGLAIAAENARLVGGTLDVSSQPGTGTRFIFEVPTSESDGTNTIQASS